MQLWLRIRDLFQKHLYDPKHLIYRHTCAATVPSLMRATITVLPYSNHCPSLGRSFFWCTAPLQMVTSGTDTLIPGHTVPPHSFSMWLKKQNPNSLNYMQNVLNNPRRNTQMRPSILLVNEERM